jgi:hypothetical protein
MTAIEYIVAWIESSRPHYDRLVRISTSTRPPENNGSLAISAFNLAADAYREMVRGGDAWAGDHSPETLLDAAKALLAWELEA